MSPWTTCKISATFQIILVFVLGQGLVFYDEFNPPGLHSITVIFVRNEIGDQSSNSGQGCFRFSLR